MSWIKKIFRRTRPACTAEWRRGIEAQLARVERKLDIHMATTKERLDQIEKDLTEGLGEVTAEIAKLREIIAGNDPAAIEAALASIEGKAAALKDIIPNAPPAEPA